MKCVFCGAVFDQKDIGNDVEKDKAVIVGNKLICVNCLRSLSILLKEIEVGAKISKL